MKLHDTTVQGHNVVTAYGEGYIAINGIEHHASLIVAPDHLIESWPVTSARELRVEDFRGLMETGASVILLGTGAKQVFPPPALLRSLSTQGKAVEVMDSFAACRTYNILVAEGRDVVAGLILPVNSNTAHP